MVKLILLVGKIALTLVGWLFLGFLIYLVASETYTFTDPKFKGFWKDVRAHQLREPSAKTLEELGERYGEEAVTRYIVDPSMIVSYLPSEEAAFANLVGYLRKEKRVQENQELSIPLPVVWGLLLVVAYVPIVVSARQTQRMLSAVFCLGWGPNQARDAYFSSVRAGGTFSGAGAFGVTFALCFVSAFYQMTPALREFGISILDLATSLLVLAYFGGLWMKLLSYIIDIVLLAVGTNPHRTVWDELVALCVMSPVLWFVYDNSGLTILTNAAAGLAAGLFLKLPVWRQH